MPLFGIGYIMQRVYIIKGIRHFLPYDEHLTLECSHSVNALIFT